jgi:hypothetical protein
MPVSVCPLERYWLPGPNILITIGDAAAGNALAARKPTHIALEKKYIMFHPCLTNFLPKTG